MLIELIYKVILTGFVVYGFHEVTRPKRIFGLWSKVLTKKGENRFYLANTFGECAVCMSSLFGTISLLLTNSEEAVLEWTIIFVISLPLLVTVFELCIRDIDFDNNHKVRQMALKYASAASGFFYIMSLSFFVYFVFPGCRLESVVFLFALAGFISLIDGFMIIVKSVPKLVKSVDATSEVIANSAEAIIEKINK